VSVRATFHGPMIPRAVACPCIPGRLVRQLVCDDYGGYKEGFVNASRKSGVMPTPDGSSMSLTPIARARLPGRHLNTSRHSTTLSDRPPGLIPNKDVTLVRSVRGRWPIRYTDVSNFLAKVDWSAQARFGRLGHCESTGSQVQTMGGADVLSHRWASAHR
jgi:hypothetical protein